MELKILHFGKFSLMADLRYQISDILNYESTFHINSVCNYWASYAGFSVVLAAKGCSILTNGLIMLQPLI